MALIIVAVNLRLAVAALPPVLSQIRHDTGLSSAGGGLLTALPVFCFGLAALATPRLIRRFSMSPLLALTLLALIAGCLLRMAPPMLTLFGGTAVLGAGIAVANVLVPGLIKRDFADQRVLMTALYSVALSGSAAIGAGLTVPLEHTTGVSWRVAITLWTVFAVLALVMWAPHVRHERRRGDVGGSEGAPIHGLWRDGLAWCVTAYFGIQSFGFYSVLSWLPTILESHGMSASTAGAMLSVSAVTGMFSALVAPSLERRAGHHGTLVTISIVLIALGYVGLLVAGGTDAWIWCAILGLGNGAPLSLALGYIVARAPDSNHAAHLSTMVQSGGYLIAAAGPFAMGALHGITGSWIAPLAMLLISLVPMLLSGLVAAQDRLVLAGKAAGRAVG